MAAAAFVTDLTEILTQVAEAAAGLASIITGFKLLDLSRDYYNLYKHQREYYYATFQTGLEQPLAAETYADAPYALNYVGRVATAYNADTGPFGGKSTDAAAWWARHGLVYNTPNDTRLAKQLVFDLAGIKSDWTNYLFRFEEQFYDVANDIRWRKRLAVHNIGIKQGTAVAGSLDSSLGEYANHIQDFGNQLATYGNGIAKYAGYKRGMADTADDFGRMHYEQRVPEQAPVSRWSMPQ
jgi:hypothetical protein